MNRKRYIFVIGTGRTGTRFLSSFFDRHCPDCLAVQEPSHRIKLLSNLYLSGKVRQKTLVDHLSSFKKKVDNKLDKKDENVYMQADAWLIGFAGVLNKVFPKPYVIHIVRDPLTYIPSILNRYYKETVQGFLRDVIPYWKLRGDKTGDISSRRWKKLSPEEKMAWQWRKHNSYIDSCSSLYKRFLRLKYENMYRGKDPGLKRMVDFCGLKLDMKDEALKKAAAKKLNTAEQKFPPASRWPSSVYDSVIRTCKPYMKRYGYL